MLKIAIIHPGLEAGGGSESCALWLAENLKKDYKVTLITTCVPDFEKLNRAYGTNLSDGQVYTIVVRRPVFFPEKFSAFRNRFPRFCKRISPKFDVMISTYNPMDFGKKGIQIIADLNFDWELSRKYNRGLDFEKVIYKDSLYRKFYLKIAEILRGAQGDWKKNTTISLSQWLANRMKESFGTESSVVYPPVLSEFPDTPFGQRENGFILIGRIWPEKEIEKVIRILKTVRRSNPNIHLHIIGRAYDSRSDYSSLIKELCAENKEWCFFEGEMYGQKKLDFIASHKYGISGRSYEPWGIAVAEMAKAGCVVFVPNGGGQLEIVDSPDLVYNDEDDAVKKIKKVLGAKDLQAILQNHLFMQGHKFSVERFVREARKVIDEFIHKLAGC